MTTKIYVLTETDGEIRYVGKTGKSISKRFNEHLCNARRGIKSHLFNWLRSILSTGHLPTISLIGEIEGDGSKEEIAWITYGRAEGWRLVNQTDGGEGCQGCFHPFLSRTSEWRKKISKTLQGHFVSGDTRVKQGKIKIGNKNAKGKRSKTSRLRMSIARKNYFQHLRDNFKTTR